jgi:hypothetical protein
MSTKPSSQQSSLSTKESNIPFSATQLRQKYAFDISLAQRSKDSTPSFRNTPMSDDQQRLSHALDKECIIPTGEAQFPTFASQERKAIVIQGMGFAGLMK